MGNLRVETTPNERETERKTLGKKKAAPTDASIDSVIIIINVRERVSKWWKREKGDLMLHDLTVNAFDFVRCVSSGVLLLPAAAVATAAWGRKSKSFCCVFYSYRRDTLPLIAPRRNVGAFALAHRILTVHNYASALSLLHNASLWDSHTATLSC